MTLTIQTLNKMNSYLPYYISSLIIIVAVISDKLLSKTITSQYYKAIVDNATHGIIGALTWTVVCIICRNRLITTSISEILLCLLMSSLIDVDHFINARSLRLQDALSYQTRPFLHCTSVPILILLILYIIGISQKTNYVNRIWIILFSAIISHHTRDATRHGYWLWPFGSTPAINYYLYLCILSFIPFIAKKLIDYANACHLSITHRDIVV